MVRILDFKGQKLSFFCLKNGKNWQYPDNLAISEQFQSSFRAVSAIDWLKDTFWSEFWI